MTDSERLAELHAAYVGETEHIGACGDIAFLLRLLERAERNLATRDKFIVERGLWGAFVDQLPSVRAALTPPAYPPEQPL